MNNPGGSRAKTLPAKLPTSKAASSSSNVKKAEAKQKPPLRRGKSPPSPKPGPSSSPKEQKSKRRRTITNKTLDNSFNSCLESDASLYNIDTSNRFSSLEEVNMDPEEPTGPSVKAKRPPPLVIRSKLEQATLFFKKIRSLVKGEVEFKCIAREDYEKTLIKTNVINEYKIIKTYLVQHNYQFYTYGLEEEVPVKIVLKGLHRSVTSEEVRNSLRDQGHEPLDIIQLTRKGSDIKIPTFILKYAPGKDIKPVTSIKHLFYTKIYWEKFKSSQRVQQCYRCQEMGHISVNCTLPERCVRCSGPHKNQDCKSDILKCANCKGNHAASNPDCPARVKTVNLKPKKQTSTKSINLSSSNKVEFPDLPNSRGQDSLVQKRTIPKQTITYSQAAQHCFKTNEQGPENSSEFTSALMINILTKFLNLVIKLIEAKDSSERNSILREEGDTIFR